MFFCLPIVCGEYTFQGEVKGYGGIVCQCHNCGNISGHVIKSRPFFTLCFVPIIPYTISGFTEVVCHICRFKQPLQNRPDVMAMADGGSAGGQPGYIQQPYQGHPPPRYG